MHETISTLEVAAVVASRVFAVLLARRADVEATLIALAKRAARKGLAAVTHTWGKPYLSRVLSQVRWNGSGYEFPCDPVEARIVQICDGFAWAEVPCSRIDLTIEGETPHYAGWSFVAALQHLDGENLVRALPGETVPESYRDRGPVCDHCKAARRRNDTYVVRHDDGRHLQVGSTCIGDFLGSDDAGKIAAAATYEAAIRACAEEGCSGFGSNSSERLLTDFLAFVAWDVRENGWISRTAARERGSVATADSSWTLLTDLDARAKRQAKPSPEDVKLAEDAATWAESISDATIAGERSDYLHNVRAVARTGLATPRTNGIGASIVTAYQRAIGREQARKNRPETRNEWIGEVGTKVSFGHAPKLGKKGQPLKGAPIVLSMDPVTLDFITGYDSAFGYVNVIKFRTSTGETLVWKTGSTDLDRACVGRAYRLVGTIKAHGTYKDAKQTVLTRCAVEAVEVAAVETVEASDAAQ